MLSPTELQHLDFIASNLVAKADQQTQITITVTGLADSNTGTEKRNDYLSTARGQYISEILTQKYGISPERLVIQSEVVHASGNPAFDRAVTISF